MNRKQNKWRYTFFIIGVILSACLSIACASKPTASGGITLDQAIAEAAAQIDAEFSAGTKIALLNFNSPSDRFSLYVLDELSVNLIASRKLTIVDRAEVDLIRSEFAFQFSGEVSDDSMQALGRMLGAQSIVSGSLTEIGGDYRITIRVLNVETAVVAVHYRTDIANDNRVRALLAGGRSETTTTVSGGTTARGGQTAQSAAIANGTYTFFPRPRSMRAGVDQDAYLDKIVVRGGYFTVYITDSARGEGRLPNFRTSYDWGSNTSLANARFANLQDLDRPSRVYSGVTMSVDRQLSYSFQNVTGRRFSLYYDPGFGEPFSTFEEINLDNAEYEPL